MLIIKIHNDGTGTNESANYDYGVYINDRRIANGYIKDHDRNKGWLVLLGRLIIHELETNPN